MSVFQNFSAKSSPHFFTISLGQFGPKTCSGRIALCALLHRRKLVEIEHFCIFSMQKRPSFYIRCCKIPVYRFYSKYHMHTFCHKFNIFKELLLSCTSGWPKDTELIVQCSLDMHAFQKG